MREKIVMFFNIKNKYVKIVTYKAISYRED